MNGVWMASVIMPSRHSRWLVRMVTILNRASWMWPRKMLPVMNFVGGMYFRGALGKISRAICACASSYRKVFSTAGSISKAWPRPICPSRMPAVLANASFRNWEASTV